MSGQSVAGDLVVIQRNPMSGTGARRNVLRQLIASLKSSGFAVRLFAGRERLDDFIRRQPPGRLRCLVAAGGDGTVASLVNRHPGVAVATLPMGTENLLARHLGIACNGAAVAELIRAGCCRLYDMARMGSRTFLVMASAGVDAAVVERLHRTRKGNIRRWYYVSPVLRSFFGYSFTGLRVRSPDCDQIMQGTHVIVSNFPEYGFRLRFNPDACPTDGLLDVCVYQGTTAISSACHAIATRIGTQRSRRVVRFRARHILVEPVSSPESENSLGAPPVSGRVPIQTDGDPAGSLPVSIEVNPSAMRLIVPGPLRPPESGAAVSTEHTSRERQ